MGKKIAKKRTSRPEDKTHFDVIILGSGPAGSTAAELLAISGQKVAIVEADLIGGECLNYGCIPTKTMLSTAHLFQKTRTNKTISNASALKLSLPKLIQSAEAAILKSGSSSLSSGLAKSGVTILKGRGYFINPKTLDVNGKSYSASKFIIATGGEPCIPDIPGLDGTEFLTYRNFIDKVKLKVPKSVTIIGGGAVGCEYAQILAACSIKTTLIECAPRLLSNAEPEASAAVLQALEKSGVKVYLGGRVNSAHLSSTGNLKEINLTHHKTNFTLRSDTLMIATGKRIYERDGFHNAGLECQNGFIPTNNFQQSSQSHIYVIGDAAGPNRLTSTALRQAQIATAHILSSKKRSSSTADLLKLGDSPVPQTVFTMPEVAMVGPTTNQLKNNKKNFRVSLVKLSELTRSHMEENLEGFVKLWSDPRDGHLLGGCIAGPTASEMIGHLSLAVQTKVTVGELADSIQVFPTWSEAVRLAASEL